jgi:hypothetical protein
LFVASALQDTKEGLAEDQKFYANLDKNCALKKTEWAAHKEMEAKELVALPQFIGILRPWLILVL